MCWISGDGLQTTISLESLDHCMELLQKSWNSTVMSHIPSRKKNSHHIQSLAAPCIAQMHTSNLKSRPPRVLLSAGGWGCPLKIQSDLISKVSLRNTPFLVWAFGDNGGWGHQLLTRGEARQSQERQSSTCPTWGSELEVCLGAKVHQQPISLSPPPFLPLLRPSSSSSSSSPCSSASPPPPFDRSRYANCVCVTKEIWPTLLI